MRAGLSAVLGSTAAIAGVSAGVPASSLAATPRAVAAGKVWLLVTSGLVADHPIAPSIIGFALVGAAAVVLAGSRVAFVAGAVGHVGSALVVYGLLAAAHNGWAADRLDYGTSDVVAAWLGAIAVVVWVRRSPLAAVALCVAAAAVGWACEGTLSILDWEHAVALAIGISTAKIGSLVTASPHRLIAH